MENASKALIIAGEILIAIIILSILVAVIMAFGNYSSDTHKKIADREIFNFNNHFLQYEGRANITAQEIATIINFAKKENDKNEISRKNPENNESYINIKIDDKYFFTDIIKNDSDYDDSNKFYNKVNQFIKDNNQLYFRCATSITEIKEDKGIKKIKTETSAKDEQDLKFNGQSKVNEISFHRIKQTDYNISDSIEINIEKDIAKE